MQAFTMSAGAQTTYALQGNVRKIFCRPCGLQGVCPRFGRADGAYFDISCRELGNQHAPVIIQQALPAGQYQRRGLHAWHVSLRSVGGRGGGRKTRSENVLCQPLRNIARDTPITQDISPVENPAVLIQRGERY
ncbi:MAG: hypothetical protein ABI327_09860 [Burkholderiaceae bacterium]